MARHDGGMQPDAATQPQDRSDFDTQIQFESHFDLSVRRG
jgi:hypothetical protein